MGSLDIWKNSDELFSLSLNIGRRIRYGSVHGRPLGVSGSSHRLSNISLGDCKLSFETRGFKREGN